MNSKISAQSVSDKSVAIRGYLEGYYGKLLRWQEREQLISSLPSQRLNTYCYAPKEDTKHRLHWREPYDPEWYASFAQFCALAQEHKVSIVAGIAPGLDFNFFDENGKSDFDRLLNKAKGLLANGADHILILWDDIEESNYQHSNGLSEGAAHARIVNQLSESLEQDIWVVPRVYAEEINDTNNYLGDFFSELNEIHTVLLCGNAIVSNAITPKDLQKLSGTINADSNCGAFSHRIVAWDNFYANDYCPRRLFAGPWVGRETINDFLINPTGMPLTDSLLLDIAVSTHTSKHRQKDWADALVRHGVPDIFHVLAPYFDSPFFGNRAVLENSSDTQCIETTELVKQAIEHCLWKWKSPLAREWYPFIMSLKHDLALMGGNLPRDRVLKTQPAPLANRLLG